MRAVIAQRKGGPEVLEPTSVADPVAGPGEVLIAVAVIGVNFAETMMRSGNYPLPVQFPTVLGSEVAGTIVSVGTDVDGGMVGRRVVAAVTNGYAELAVAAATEVHEVPEGLDLYTAASITVQAFTALGILRDAGRLTPGDSVLIEAAAGGVGSWAIQIAKLLGAGRVIGLTTSAAKLGRIEELGADRAVLTTDPDWADILLAEEEPIDLVLASVGGAPTRAAADLLRQRSGRLIAYGSLSGAPIDLGAMDLIFPSITLTGFALPPWLAVPGWAAQALAQISQWVLDGKLIAPLGPRYPLAEAAEAHRALEARETSGKVLLLT